MKFQMVEHHGDDGGKHGLGQGEDAGFLRAGVAGPFQKCPEGDHGAADNGVEHAKDGGRIPSGRGEIRSSQKDEEQAAQEHGGPHDFHGAIGFG